jgi:predicted cytidylate kinase
MTHISITGDLGSGKSTVAKELCRILNYNYLSTGLIQRQLGLEKGMDTLEFNRFMSDNQEIDDYIDDRLRAVNRQTEPYVLDSRLGWHFVPQSFKVYLTAADEVAARRVLADGKRIGEPQTHDVEAKIKDLQERRRIENERFAAKYGVRPNLAEDFDAVVDTSSASVEEVVNRILDLYSKHNNSQKI